MGSSARIVIAIVLLLTGGAISALPAGSQEMPANPDFWIELEPVAGGFNLPTFIADPGDGSGRLFILEKPGVIYVLEDGERIDEPFLDISDRTYSVGFEEGLFAIEFDPDFAENGIFYITSSPEEGKEWRLERFRVSDDDPNRADRDSAETILSVDHLGHTHYGGMMQFGSDGHLWVSLGDGGGAYDPYSNGQNPNTLFGTLMRIDPSEPSEDREYAIPDDNPFVGVEDHRPEVFAYGLRNPWRFSFDWETGDLYIADVGQNVWEEVNYIPAGPEGIPEGGQNFGWPQMEGMQCSDRAEECDPDLYDHPVAQYNHFYGCSVSGGHVYRGDPESPIYGHYLYGDFCEGKIWSMTEGEEEWDAAVRIDTSLNISTFGEDDAGNLYVADHYGGGIYRVETTTDAPTPVITGTEPGAIPAGTVGCTLDIHGWNFSQDAQVALDGEGQATTFFDPSHLRIDLSSERLTEPGQREVTVEQGSESESIMVDVTSGIQDQAIQERWSRADGAVADGSESRTWLWGPQALACALEEEYAETPGGTRVVQYFDKSRMEITNPNGDPGDDWYVTNGLLVEELITGRRQVGDAEYEQLEPAEINLAGDVDDTDSPTYAAFGALLDEPASETGTAITRRVDDDAAISDDPALAEFNVTNAYYVAETDHTVASPFWEFMNEGDAASEFSNPFYATGLPISEAYWTRIRVGGEEQDVLVQLFERRVLTYTPGNAEGWQVEAGNAGQHYFIWRYGWDALPTSSQPD